MALIDKSTLVAKLSPPFDAFLATQLVDEFVSLERRFILRDWEPAQLDGGHFCEVLGRILYHQDADNLDVSRDFGDCSKYIHNDQVTHGMNRDDAKMLFMAITVIHKFRSKRGVGHVSPTYTANHMDARYMMEAVRWAMVEAMRIFWAGDREAAAKAIQELLQFDVPCVGKFEDRVVGAANRPPPRRGNPCIAALRRAAGLHTARPRETREVFAKRRDAGTRCLSVAWTT